MTRPCASDPAQDPDNILYRLAEVAGLRANLALAVATARVADETIGSAQTTAIEKEIARQAKADDLPALKEQVRRLLSTAVRGGQLFFRGTTYQVADGDSASAAARATLSQVLPQIYTRFAEVAAPPGERGHCRTRRPGRQHVQQ